MTAQIIPFTFNRHEVRVLEPDGPFHLVAGAHRLKAMESLGEEWIDAFFIKALSENPLQHLAFVCG